MTDDERPAAVDLYWIPLGAGGRFVRFNGKVFEALSAMSQHRPRRDLYHSALAVTVPEGPFVIEMTPVPDAGGSSRGVVGQGSVGLRWAGLFRIFRYEIRRWRDGVIPDAEAAVDGPVTVADDPLRARLLLDLVPMVPRPTWGRDELRAGEMWNSNSVVSWLLARSGVDVERIRLPGGGRAPGWDAGLRVAERSTGPAMSEAGALTDALPRRRADSVVG